MYSIIIVLQVGLSPFIFSSRRNYHEGTLFSLGSFACLVIWVSWTSAYFGLVPGGSNPEWFAVAVCCGLIATPSCLLLVLFVPKVCRRTQ